jgi:hypothetical protein
VLTLYPRHVKLVIEENLALEQIPEAFRMAIQVCRFNEIHDALLVTDHADSLQLRAGLRAALRTMMARGMMPPVRLALVGLGPEALKALQGLKELAAANSILCEVFSEEEAGLAWFAKLDDGKLTAIR